MIEEVKETEESRKLVVKLLNIFSVDMFCNIIDEINEKNGWNTERSFEEWTVLAHSELSESYEEHRNGRGLTEIYYNDSSPTKPEGIPIELADCVIRIMHYFARNGISLRDALVMKLSYNATRPFRHGGKRT